jgi:hypothetical protein
MRVDAVLVEHVFNVTSVASMAHGQQLTVADEVYRSEALARSRPVHGHDPVHHRPILA